MLQAWRTMFELGKNDSGRGRIEGAMRVCPRLLNSSDDVMALADWASSAWDYMAM
jgi:hypothetical protein